MVKHTQTIRRQKPTHCLMVFDQSVGLALKKLTVYYFLQNVAKFAQNAVHLRSYANLIEM